MTNWFGSMGVLAGVLASGWAYAQTSGPPSAGTQMTDAQCEVVWARIAKVSLNGISPSESERTVTDFKAADTNNDGVISHAEFLVACNKGLVNASTTEASEQTSKVLTSLPSQSIPISDVYKKSVYDSVNNKVGDVNDVILSPDGRVTALIVGVGGFLGMGENDIAVPFDAVKRTTKDNRTYLTLDATKDQLRSAPGFKYDRSKYAWVPESANK